MTLTQPNTQAPTHRTIRQTNKTISRWALCEQVESSVNILHIYPEQYIHNRGVENLHLSTPFLFFQQIENELQQPYAMLVLQRVCCGSSSSARRHWTFRRALLVLSHFLCYFSFFISISTSFRSQSTHKSKWIIS